MVGLRLKPNKPSSWVCALNPFPVLPPENLLCLLRCPVGLLGRYIHVLMFLMEKRAQMAMSLSYHHTCKPKPPDVRGFQLFLLRGSPEGDNAGHCLLRAVFKKKLHAEG